MTAPLDPELVMGLLDVYATVEAALEPDKLANLVTDVQELVDNLRQAGWSELEIGAAAIAGGALALAQTGRLDLVGIIGLALATRSIPSATWPGPDRSPDG